MKIRTLSFVLILGLVISACDSSPLLEDLGAGQSERVTTVTLTLKSAGLDDIVVVASDPDGDGIDFSIDDLSLNRNTVYTGEIYFEDDIGNLNITNEVRNESEYHQVHFMPESSLDIAVLTTDEDDNGQALGLLYTVTTEDATSGNLRIVLSHYNDDSPKDGTSLSDESDVDFSFPVVVGGVVGG